MPIHIKKKLGNHKKGRIYQIYVHCPVAHGGNHPGDQGNFGGKDYGTATLI